MSQKRSYKAKCIIQSFTPIFPIWLDYLFQNLHKLFIWNFNFTIGLWMVRCRNFMDHTLCPQQCFHVLIAKMNALVTYNGFWNSKLAKIIILGSLNLHLFGNIINSKKNVSKAKRKRKEIYEIDTLNINYFTK